MADLAAQPDANQTTEQADQDRTAGSSKDALVSMTQDALNSLIANEVRKERQKAQSHYGDYDDLKAKAARLAELEQAQMSELEKLQKQLAQEKTAREQMQAEIEAERLTSLRLRVGQEFGLPVELATRLTGNTEEDIRADAEKLQALIKVDPSTRIPNIDATAGSGQATSGGVKLTPEQEQALRTVQQVDPTMTRERYIKSLLMIEGKDK